MLIPGGTGGTDPTSLPRDRFCGQVFLSDQIQKTTSIYNKKENLDKVLQLVFIVL